MPKSFVKHTITHHILSLSLSHPLLLLVLYQKRWQNEHLLHNGGKILKELPFLKQASSLFHGGSARILPVGGGGLSEWFWTILCTFKSSNYSNARLSLIVVYFAWELHSRFSPTLTLQQPTAHNDQSEFIISKSGTTYVLSHTVKNGWNELEEFNLRS